MEGKKVVSRRKTTKHKLNYTCVISLVALNAFGAGLCVVYRDICFCLKSTYRGKKPLICAINIITLLGPALMARYHAMKGMVVIIQYPFY